MAVAQNEKLNLNGIKLLNDSEYDDRSYNPQSDKVTYLHGRKPKKIRFFANGDKFFQGKKISVHSHKYQCIEDLLTELTNKMPPQVYLPNGIRQIFSPSSGRRITDLDQLDNGHDYVCAGNEAFKSISYGQNPRDPWFKGRPQNFSRYPQLMPFGLGSVQSIHQNPDSNNYQKSDAQSNYIGQNAFPTRFYRPTGPAYLSKNVIGHFASHGSSVAYPKLIKFRSKGASNQNNSYYQELLSQQVKPKVITVVKGGPETPKSFVRILLNKRSVQSYETLVTDIETSLRDQSQQKIMAIGRIFNLFGKEIKSVADFFKSDDFFIAIGDQDHLGMKQVKEILDDMYPDHPQTEQILQFWGVKKVEGLSSMDQSHDQERIPNFHGSNISVDKRDSGFEEQDFSKESEFASNANITAEKDSTLLPKPKPSKNKASISRKKKSTSKTNIFTNSIQKVVETDSMDLDKSSGRYSPVTYRKITQERNAERLRAAFEDREKARILMQEQLKAERKRMEDYSMNSNGVYSQYMRKSISEKGSIDVFKKMDEASLETRKQKLRQKLEKQNHGNGIYSGDSSTYQTARDKREPEELPFIDTMSSSTVTSRINNKEIPEQISPVQTELVSSTYQLSPPVIRKLNKITEAPNESNIEEQNLALNRHTEIQKDINVEKPKKIGNRLRRPSQDAKQNKKIKEKPENVSPISSNELKQIVVQQNNTNSYEQQIDAMLTIDKENKDTKLNQENSREIIKNKSVSKSIIRDPTPIESSPIKTPSIININQDNQTTTVNVAQPQRTKDTESKEKILTEVPENNNQSATPDKEVQVHDNLLNEKTASPIEKVVIQRKLSFPGNRVMGKLCRQIASPQIVYQRFETSKVLGDGNFAVVKMAVRKENKREYALKIIDKSKMRGKESMIENEIWIMKLCNHENIIKLKEEYESREEIFLVMELIKGGDLFDAITQSVKFSEPIAAKMVIDMTSALFYLHSRRVVHRDLKPENLMVLRHRDGSITLKLADFGLAMEVKKLIYTVCGTPTYVAPEILTEQGYSLEVDLWALGVITYILLCGFPPFRSPKRDQDQLFEFIKSGNFEYVSPYWDKISHDVKDLISKLLVVDRRQRYTTIQVLSHKWIMGKGSSGPIGDEAKRTRTLQLEEEAKSNLEDFQLKKKELRQAINREIQAAYSSPSK